MPLHPRRAENDYVQQQGTLHPHDWHGEWNYTITPTNHAT